MNKALILFSGGGDSLLTASLARERGDEIRGLHFGYGQRAADGELRAAGRLAEYFRMVLDYQDLSRLMYGVRGSILRGVEGDLTGPEVVVPARNTLFLAVALAAAERVGAGSVWIGCNEADRELFPDCRQEFLIAADRMFLHATEGRIRLEFPLVTWSKARIVAGCRERGLPLAMAWSCYGAGEAPCGTCLACVTRAEAEAAPSWE